MYYVNSVYVYAKIIWNPLVFCILNSLLRWGREKTARRFSYKCATVIDNGKCMGDCCCPIWFGAGNINWIDIDGRGIWRGAMSVIFSLPVCQIFVTKSLFVSHLKSDARRASRWRPTWSTYTGDGRGPTITKGMDDFPDDTDLGCRRQTKGTLTTNHSQSQLFTKKVSLIHYLGHLELRIQYGTAWIPDRSRLGTYSWGGEEHDSHFRTPSTGTTSS